MKPILISLCDYSGEWARPWLDTHQVILVDPKHPRGATKKDPAEKDGMTCYGMCVHEFAWNIIGSVDWSRVDVILAAPPCTHFSSSGARWWAEKDADGRTERHVQIVKWIMYIVKQLKPSVFALENPVGRINKLVPELGEPLMRFNPCEYAGWADDPDKEAYTKKTCLYGWFNSDLTKKPVEPIFITASNGDRYSPIMMATGGKSERTKELRSTTPAGFARAFRAAHKNEG